MRTRYPSSDSSDSRDSSEASSASSDYMVVGRGAYASVYINADGYAVKRYTSLCDGLFREINFLNHMRNTEACSRYASHFPEMKEFSIDYTANMADITLENCGVALNELLRLKAFKLVSLENKLKLFSRVLSAVAAIHSVGFIHCDIKPDNIMLQLPGSVVNVPTWKEIVEMAKAQSEGSNKAKASKMKGVVSSLSMYIDACMVKLIDFNKVVPISNLVKSTSVCQFYYTPPEIIMGDRQYNESVDTWAAMCVLGEMLLGRVLWNPFNEQQASERHPLPSPECPKGCNSSDSSSYGSSSSFSYSADVLDELAMLFTFAQVLGPNTSKDIQGRFSDRFYRNGKLVGDIGGIRTGSVTWADIGIPEKLHSLFSGVFKYDCSSRLPIHSIQTTLESLL